MPASADCFQCSGPRLMRIQHSRGQNRDACFPRPDQRAAHLTARKDRLQHSPIGCHLPQIQHRRGLNLCGSSSVRLEIRDKHPASGSTTSRSTSPPMTALPMTPVNGTSARLPGPNSGARSGWAMTARTSSMIRSASSTGRPWAGLSRNPLRHPIAPTPEPPADAAAGHGSTARAGSGRWPDPAPPPADSAAGTGASSTPSGRLGASGLGLGGSGGGACGVQSGAIPSHAGRSPA